MWRKREKALASKTSILSHSDGEVRLPRQGKPDRVSQMPGLIPQHEKKETEFVLNKELAAPVRACEHGGKRSLCQASEPATTPGLCRAAPDDSTAGAEQRDPSTAPAAPTSIAAPQASRGAVCCAPSPTPTTPHWGWELPWLRTSLR